MIKSSKSPSHDPSRHVICTLTVDSHIKQALFTTFYSYPDYPAMLGDPVSDKPSGRYLLRTESLANDSELLGFIVLAKFNFME